ncbi:MAG: monovalent cation:proton antiporter-2 (CPA2) family protein [Pseudomonadota bacterium]
MSHSGYLQEVIIILLAAIIGILLFKRIGLGSVLGYLVAGAIIGPFGFGFVVEDQTIQSLAELGVVFLLFTVGLELPFERIRVMFGRIFALGAAQVIVTGTVFAVIAYLLGVRGPALVVIGAGLALSSTAIVLRMLSDRGELTSVFGRTAFGVLLVQDLMVGPFLVIVVAFGQGEGALASVLGLATLKAVAAVMAILGLGKIVLRQALAQVAAIREPEVFAGFTLLIVLASSLLTQAAGLSMGFGAFLAGMLLAETHYRHQVAAEIQPFRGLLLGLFFMTIGMSIDVELTLERTGIIVLLVLTILIVKAGLLVGLARIFGLPTAQSLSLGLLLCQGGEFSFVLLGAGAVTGLLASEQAQLLVVAVALTMMVTPFLAGLGRTLEGRVESATVARVVDIQDTIESMSGHVVIAGYGRVGATVAKQLTDAGQPYIAVDLDPRRIAQAQARNLPLYYGDATNPEILAALHVERAQAVVVAVDDPKAALSLVALLSYIFPNLKVYARAKDETHARQLEEAGAHIVVPELIATGVKLAGEILETDSKPAE